ncbi:MAG: peptidoglycan DD-metalloendopeptidase family protein [Bacilli bacterium]
MKKHNIIISFFILFAFTFFTMPSLNAETLRDYYNQLNTAKANKAKQEQNKQLTKEQYQRTVNEIGQIGLDIEDGRRKIAEAKLKIIQLDKDIDAKKSEINELLKFLQISEGGNVYLEYVFGATDFTDFIFRTAVVEQLSSHNDKVIKEMNKMIKQNIKLQEDLKKKEVELNNKNKQLDSKLASLGTQIALFDEEVLTIDDEIKIIQETINFYEGQKCKMDEDVLTCVKMPVAFNFLRPIERGGLASPFGWRKHPITGIVTMHNGVDLYATEGINIYAAAAGMVVHTIDWNNPIAGRQVYIKHIVNGVHYTTIHKHMLQVNVKKGDVVRQNTVIGKVGGGSTRCIYDKTGSYCISGYDKYTTGAHLHFELVKGWYLGGDYTAGSTYLSNLLNPADYISIPSYFNSRG